MAHKNRHSKNVWGLWLTLLATVFLSCASPKDVEVRGVSIAGFDNLDQPEASIGVNLVLFNPNPFPVEITGSQLGLRVDGDSLGVLTLAPGVRLERKSEANIHVHARIDSESMQQVLSERWFEFLLTGVPVQVSGWVQGKAWGVQRTLRIQHEERIRVIE